MTSSLQLGFRLESIQWAILGPREVGPEPQQARQLAQIRGNTHPPFYCSVTNPRTGTKGQHV
jgi:hypothetical protein